MGARIRLCLLYAAAALSACSEEVTISELEPKISVDGMSLDFGELQLGERVERSLRISNPGDAPLVLTAVEPGTPFDGAAFHVDGVPTSIAAGASGFVQLSFTPVKLGPTSGFLRVRPAFQKLGEPLIELRGKGVTAELQLEPRNLSFGSVLVGQRVTLPLRMTNPGDKPIVVAFQAKNNLRFCGAQNGDAASFCLATTDRPLDAEGEFALGAHATTSFNVTYAPENETADRGELSLKPCPTCAELAVKLDGRGVNQGFECTPMKLDFGLVNPMACVNRKATCTNHVATPITVVGWRAAPDRNTSPDFQLPTFTGAQTLSANQSLELEVRYCPTALGPAAGVFEVETDQPNAAYRFVRLDLLGEGGGANIRVTPRALAFGQVSLLAPSRRGVLVENLGLMPLEITAIEVDTARTGVFTSAAVPAVIEPGHALDLAVVFKPRAEGSVTSSVVLFSNDQDQAMLVIPLSGTGVNLPPCDFTARPSPLQFGIVERGRIASRSFEVINRGAAECLLTGARILRDESGPEFTLPDGPPDSVHIPPGGATTVRVQYAPLEAAAHQGVVEFSISSPSSPFNRIPLSGNAATDTLLIVPTEVDFGAIGSRCSARARPITIYNTGAAPVRIDRIQLAEPVNPAFTLRGLPAVFPHVLDSGGSLVFDAEFTAGTAAGYAGAIEIQVQRATPETYFVSLDGKAGVNARQVDRFEQLGRPSVDLLFVIDDSLSMEEEQEALGANFQSFAQFATSQQIDYHLGVTTTDIDRVGGRLVPLGGSSVDRIVTPMSRPSPAEAFQINANVGLLGSGEEQGLEAAYLALSARAFDDNLGFLRPEAVLSVVVVSDEDDQSFQSVGFYVDFFRSIKGFRNTNLFSLSGIIGDTPDGCMGVGGTAVPGMRYEEAVQRTGGVLQSICTADWSRSLSELSATAFGFKNRFFLSNAPERPSLVVSVDGVVVPDVAPSGTVTWRYDYTTNAIVFNAATTPEPGAQIQIEYAVECL